MLLLAGAELILALGGGVLGRPVVATGTYRGALIFLTGFPLLASALSSEISGKDADEDDDSLQAT